MHTIYAGSFVTIVSLGESQHDGLPGVGQVRRTKQAILTTNDTSYVTAMLSLLGSVVPSKWASRGWCYQEAVLSGRLLIFAPDQVHFVCRSAIKSESINETSESQVSASSGLRLAGLSSDCKPNFGEPSSDSTRPPSWIFNEWLLSYTARDLTYQGDILNKCLPWRAEQFTTLHILGRTIHHKDKPPKQQDQFY